MKIKLINTLYVVAYVSCLMVMITFALSGNWPAFTWALIASIWCFDSYLDYQNLIYMKKKNEELSSDLAELETKLKALESGK